MSLETEFIIMAGEQFCLRCIVMKGLNGWLSILSLDYIIYTVTEEIKKELLEWKKM